MRARPRHASLSADEIPHDQRIVAVAVLAEIGAEGGGHVTQLEIGVAVEIEVGDVIGFERQLELALAAAIIIEPLAGLGMPS